MKARVHSIATALLATAIILAPHSVTATPCLQDAECDDGNVCTEDHCAVDTCTNTSIPGCCLTNVDCPADDSCAVPSCDLSAHTCDNGRKANCCTVDSDCPTQGVCSTVTCGTPADPHACSTVTIPPPDCCTGPTDCRDDNPCTFDLCDGTAHKCVFRRIEGCCLTDADCDDGNPCTIDTCVVNACRPIWMSDKCCLMPETDPATGFPWASDTARQAYGDKQCGRDVCRPVTCNLATSLCVEGSPEPDCCIADEDCDDGYVCTVDRCVNGSSCTHESKSGCCTRDGDCRDSNLCTFDHCDGTTHECVFTPISGCCLKDADCPDDGDPCTRDYCKGYPGICTHEPDSGCCHDDSECSRTDSPCTDYQCVTNSCHLIWLKDVCCLSETDCDDGRRCTLDRCTAEGPCEHGRIPGCCEVDADCDDLNPCTVDRCVSKNECSNVYDADACTHTPEAIDSAELAAVSDEGGTSDASEESIDARGTPEPTADLGAPDAFAVIDAPVDATTIADATGKSASGCTTGAPSPYTALPLLLALLALAAVRRPRNT